MSNSKFSPRQLLFLEIFFSGYSMQDAVRAAGFRGKTPQALCNRGRAILNKFSKTCWAHFLQAGPRERKIAQLLVDIIDDKSERQQLKALKIVSKCISGD